MSNPPKLKYTQRQKQDLKTLLKAVKTTEEIADMFVRNAGEETQKETYETKWVPAVLAAKEMQRIKEDMLKVIREVSKVDTEEDNCNHSYQVAEIEEKVEEVL